MALLSVARSSVRAATLPLCFRKREREGTREEAFLSLSLSFALLGGGLTFNEFAGDPHKFTSLSLCIISLFNFEKTAFSIIQEKYSQLRERERKKKATRALFQELECICSSCRLSLSHTVTCR